MDFSLTKEQEMLKKLAAQFAEEELEPVAAEIDAEHRFPTENFAKWPKLALQESEFRKSLVDPVAVCWKRLSLFF